MSRLGIAFMALALSCAACGTQPSSSPSAEESVVPSTAPPADSALVGEWVRTQDCETQLAAFEAAGIADTHAASITGNWVGEDASPDPANLCAGARPPEQHSHFFTDAGQFGSRDANGQQVDDGDFVLVDDDTVSFPSHAIEFGYDGELLVDYAVSGASATFDVELPADCEGTCLDAYAWALSAFFDGDPWTLIADR